jgi:archaellum biogenesis protein FlaJ (TadC family)
MPIEQYLAHIGNIFRSGYKSNAFAPYVWLTVIIISSLIVIMKLFDDKIITYACMLLIIFVVVFGAIMYLKLFNKDPKLLQSESYRLEDKRLDIISAKGSDVIVNPVNLSPPPQKEIGGIDE